MNTSNPDAQSAPSDPATSSQSTESGQGAAGIPFEDYKKKLEERLGELGKQMDTLKDLLSKAAHDAKQSLEQQIDKLQTDHAEEFARLAKLRAAGEASLHTLGSRLDKLVEDVTAAITSALGFAKPAEATKTDSESKSEPVAKADAESKSDAGSAAYSEPSGEPADKADKLREGSGEPSEPADKADKLQEDKTAAAEPVSTDAVKYYTDAAQHATPPAPSPAPSAGAAERDADSIGTSQYSADTKPGDATPAPADAAKNPSTGN